MKLKENKIYRNIKITGMAHDGRGVGRIEGMPVFIEYALEGEILDIIINKNFKTYSTGRIINIIEPSKERKKPECINFYKCGGCSLQHVNYMEQLNIKESIVKQALIKIAGLNNPGVLKTIGMEAPSFYRNKVQYPVAAVDNEVVFGFYKAKSHEIVRSDDCIIQDKIFNRIAQVIIDFINANKLPVYDEKKHSGSIRHIVLRKGMNTNQIMAIIVSSSFHLPGMKALAEILMKTFPNIKSVVLNYNPEKGNTIMGRKNKIIKGKGYIKEKLCGLDFLISPDSFFQVNTIQAEKLYKKVLEFAGDITGKSIFDLYCGTGTIALYLAKKAKFVTGIEIAENAVKDAGLNAKNNNIENVRFICGKAENEIQKLFNKGEKADVVVIDPPRKGCDKELLNCIEKISPKKVIYVSCNPATLARDIKYLMQHDYAVDKVQPVDMFCHTFHVECVVLMSRVEK